MEKKLQWSPTPIAYVFTFYGNGKFIIISLIFIAIFQKSNQKFKLKIIIKQTENNLMI